LLAGVVTGELPRFHPGSVSMLSLGSFVLSRNHRRCSRVYGLHLLLRHCDPAKVATYAYVNPIVAVLLGTSSRVKTVTVTHVGCRRSHHRFSGTDNPAQQLRARVEPALSAAMEPAD